MIIMIVSDCPPKVRGDLSKWLFEINTGVYVGKVSSRVREELWQRICENLRHGQATMVYPDSGEQKMAFRVHNTTWEIADFDGLKLMRRPSSIKKTLATSDPSLLKEGFSNASKRLKARKIKLAQHKTIESNSYTVIDVETTGLSPHKDQIIELAALKIENGSPIKDIALLIKIAEKIPASITKLTGITNDMLSKEGQNLENALKIFLEFIESDLLVCHNASFDIGFIQAACRKANLPIPHNQCVDTLILSRQKLTGLPDYQLSTLALHFSLDSAGIHRALKDCYLTYGIYAKLKEI